MENCMRFTKILIDIDIERRLSIPVTCFTKQYGGVGGGANTIKLVVKDAENGDKLTFVFSKRAATNSKFDIVQGWRQFVCSKNLRIGDLIDFRWEPDFVEGGSGQYKIQFKRMSLRLSV
ncbi:hypothetical protein ACFE04_022532 [Oxalis oulophora]